jgi:hypothetical protein
MPPTLTPLDTITLDAFLLALGQLDEPLPAALQERLQAIGHDLPNQVGHLDALAMDYPPLADRYSQARQDIQSASQTRKQRFSSPDAVRQDLRLAQLVLQAPDPIGTAKTLEALPAPEPIPAAPIAPPEATPPTSNSTTPKLYRFTLPTHATAPQQQQFQTYITELKQLNPNWIVSPDRPQPGEAEAYIMIYNDDNYKVSLAAHIAGQLITDFVSNVCR